MNSSRFYILVSLVLFFLLALTVDYIGSGARQMERYASRLEAYLHEQEQMVSTLFQEEELFLRLATPPIGTEDLQRALELDEAGYSLFLFRQDSLLWWNDDRIEIGSSMLRKIRAQSSPALKRFPNGYYELRSSSFTRDSTAFLIIAAIPVKHFYPLETEYLRNQFAAPDAIPADIQVRPAGETDLPVETIEGIILFSIDAKPVPSDRQHLLALLILYTLAFISLFILINNISNYLVRRYSPIAGSLFLVFSVLGLRFISVNYHFTNRFSDLQLFAKTFSTPVMDSSLGDLMINSLLFLWIMVFFYREFRASRLIRLSWPVRFTLSTLNYLSVLSGILVITIIIQNLVIDSGITFDFDNVLNLNFFSLMAITGVIFLLIAFFLFSHRMMLTVYRLRLNRISRLCASVIALLVLLPALLSAHSPISAGLFTLIGLLYLISFDLYIYSRRTGPVWIVGWLLFFSVYTSILLYQYNLERDTQLQLDYAYSILNNRDMQAEARLQELATQLSKDDSLRKFLSTGVPASVEEQAIKDIIAQRYNELNYLFNNYGYDLFAFNTGEAVPIISATDTAAFQTMLDLRRNSKPTQQYPQVFYLKDETLKYTHIAEVAFPVSANVNHQNYLLIGILPMKQESSRVYTELLMDAGERELRDVKKYDYALWSGGRIVAQRGKPQIELLQTETLPEKGRWAIFRDGQRSDLVLRGEEEGERRVVIGKALGGYFKVFSLFSYVFILQSIVVLFLAILNRFIGALPYPAYFSIFTRPSLRSRIQLGVVGLILCSFIIIGLVTAAFFHQSSVEYHDSRLLRKVNAVKQDVEHEMRLTEPARPGPYNFSAIAGPVSDIHNIDLNIYSLDGRLLTSSAEYIFNRGIIAPRMNPRAFQALRWANESRYILQDKIGNLPYQAAFVPIQHPDAQQATAYLELPYYSQDSDLRRNVYDFLGTLLNVYVFLLLGAVLIALIFANSITKPLSQIGEELRQFRLGHNKPLRWKRKDEIGALVREYNHMLDKLEESTEKLKQTEREVAWREMAKQVAHEIKNPLTPMKLSLQYLLHAYQSNPDNIGPLLERMSKTMIEQIDGLSKIASEFSNFAKMPKAQNQSLDLNQLVRSAYSLFRENYGDELDIHLDLPATPQIVIADKDHLMRVLNNLIQNAIQAIPDDRRGRIDLRLFRKEDQVVVQVSDNGSGISEEMQEKVFYPNFTTKNSGMGLGLAISKNIIDAIDGKIYFRTHNGYGTDFFVEIPAENEEERQ